MPWASAGSRDTYGRVVAPRSLPERTVDAWVAAAICRTFPGAHLWAPTQVPSDANWDYGASLGDGKVLILEDKATTPVRRKRKAPIETHWIDVPRSQLDWYCDHVEPALNVPVFYVLPAPPWRGEPTGSVVVPDQAVCRIASTHGPFEQWAYVVRSTDLRAYLGHRRGLETDELPIPASQTLAAFLEGIRRCEYGRRVSGLGEGVNAAMKGDEQGDVASVDVSQRRSRSDSSDRRMGSALGVFLPAADLPSW